MGSGDGMGPLNGTAESWHGAGVEGSLHPCQGHQTKKGFLHLKARRLITVHCIIQYSTILYLFFPLLVKNKPREGITKCVFILGPVSMAANITYALLSIK